MLQFPHLLVSIKKNCLSGHSIQFVPFEYGKSLKHTVYDEFFSNYYCYFYTSANVLLEGKTILMDFRLVNGILIIWHNLAVLL